MGFGGGSSEENTLYDDSLMWACVTVQQMLTANAQWETFAKKAESPLLLGTLQEFSWYEILRQYATYKCSRLKDDSNCFNE